MTTLYFAVDIGKLLNGTPPTSIFQNIFLQVALIMPSVEEKKLPDIRFVRNCRKFLRIISKILIAYRLSKAYKW